MDVQRQSNKEGNEQGIVSTEFQNKFLGLLDKHEDSFLKKKDELKIKTFAELINALKKD
ncbi:hypothetical protein KAI65_04130 [Candidatus Parcubacteria bacterium]|nr:hypothetical protein [Candidatus Parcubacteria bacterium]